MGTQFKKYKLICRECRSEFLTSHKRAKCCSNRCRYLYRDRRREYEYVCKTRGVKWAEQLPGFWEYMAQAREDIKERKRVAALEGSPGLVMELYMQRVMAGARMRGIPFNLDEEYMTALALKQGSRCALTGVELKFTRGSESTASLDRILSSGPYEPGNVQWVHKDVNIAKQDKTDEEFIAMCIAVAQKWSRDNGVPIDIPVSTS